MRFFLFFFTFSVLLFILAKQKDYTFGEARGKSAIQYPKYTASRHTVSQP
jgi:hypothetical protein